MIFNISEVATSRYCSYISHDDDQARCSKFESGLRPDIKQAIGYQQIAHFPELVDKCQIYEDDTKAKQAAWKNTGPQRSGGSSDFKMREIRDGKKPYSRPDHQPRRNPPSIRRPDHGGLSQPELHCYSCGGPHLQRDCHRNLVTCFRCGQQGHYTSSCHLVRNDAGGNDKGRNWTGNRNNNGSQNQMGNRRQSNLDTSRNPSGRPNVKGRMYTMSGAEATIQRLKLPISPMTENLIVSTHTGPSIATSLVCRDCNVCLEGREFFVDLICLPLSELDIILGMDWLSANHVMLDYPNKKLVLNSCNVERTKGRTQEGKDAQCTHTPRDVRLQVFTIFTVEDPKDDPVLDEIPIVREYPEVFLENVPGLPPEREVEFSINLVPGAGPVSMAPYRMSLVELAELKQQLEELFEK
ncbi:uncharacterized protein LOC113859512 [Abrus precatorius]|uniref:Uncharacterized protein LOC113859512 n=1 Tax=Abrus precatorius TaxID=3816 RepID=A0A8B8KVT8_ABRPR|nr:uncharacterized protein LOC113859512 [Abrus precatorius]